MKKAVFFDIDGTLIDGLEGLTQITPKVLQAIRRLQQDGHYVFIATGRPYAFLNEEILSFGFDGYILANGAQVMIKDEIIYKEALDQSFVKEMVALFEERGIQYMLQSDKYSYMKDHFEEFYQFFDSVGVSRDYLVGKYTLEEVETQKIEMLCPNDEALDYCISLVGKHPDYDYSHSISLRMFDLYSKKNNKATGIFKALEHLGIPVERSYAFGDGKNDIEMLSAVGCGIAMGNASDEVKLYANQVTGSVLEDGVATGIEKYILI